MLYFQIRKLLPKTYINCGWNATIARHWKSWFQNKKYLAQDEQFIMVGKKYMWTSRLIETIWIMSCAVTETGYTSKIMKLIWNGLKTSHYSQNKVISWATLTYSTSFALYWMKQLFIIKTISVKNGCSLSNDHFPILPGI